MKDLKDWAFLGLCAGVAAGIATFMKDKVETCLSNLPKEVGKLKKKYIKVSEEETVE